ncbi:MAG: hypothetical protein A2086_02725 [Spirochaetes bacterium GWD1_27_9]|nr:MAG: hypothetical protein A2Z98_14615 [Spirochaetes bacterium GWB1_27_13]OHD26765.1 MAG: hypothetical protein A2Y34_02930 [Spirochaetes bacterium GWC1_27_15]OHD31540.1 MAG: hypothetical protein A2086_02725 [Spirochaetes bacterium GWD1_27_9]
MNYLLLYFIIFPIYSIIAIYYIFRINKKLNKKYSDLDLIGPIYRNKSISLPIFTSFSFGFIFFGGMFSILYLTALIGVETLFTFIVFFLLFGGVIIGILGMYFGFATGFYCMALSILLPASFYMYFYENIQLTKFNNGAIVRHFTLEDLYSNKNISGLYLKNYQILQKFYGSYVRTTRSKNSTTTSYYYATPVVYKNWDEREPIAFWFIYEGDHKKINYSEENGYAAIIAHPISNRDNFYKAMKRSENKFNLKTVKKPILIYIVDSPEEFLKKCSTNILYTIYLTNAGWFLLVIILAIYLVNKKKTRTF